MRIYEFCPEYRGAALRLAALAVLAVLPAGCLAPEPAMNPFAGGWTDGQHGRIAFRDDTVVLDLANAAPTPMSAQTCDGRFSFGYGHWTRQTLLGLTPRQPELLRQLQAQLSRPDYAIARVTCGDGGTTYVLLDERDLLAIYQDRDIARVEHLSRL